MLELLEDGAAGKPASMTSELDQDQKDAIAWIIALPTSDDASPKLDQNLRSGPFPIMGLAVLVERNGMRTLPGVVMVAMYFFSNGKVEWYENTNPNGEGVFLKPPAEGADEDAEIEQVSDPEDALPEGWEAIGKTN